MSAKKGKKGGPVAESERLEAAVDESAAVESVSDDASTAEIHLSAEDSSAELELSSEGNDSELSVNSDTENELSADSNLDNVERLEPTSPRFETENVEVEFSDIPPDPGSADAASPRLQSIVESLLFAADRPLTLKQLGDLVGETELARVRAAVAAVEVSSSVRGFQLHNVAGGFQFRTNPENATFVQKLLAQKPVRLTRAQLETLAIVSYRQPITRPEIDQIRGVDSGGTLKTLLERSMVRILGKKEEPGRPMLYGTTRDFLEFFNLGDLKDLPSLREFHELSEEHQAQVEALAGVAPEGSLEDDAIAKDAAAADSAPTLARVELPQPNLADDDEELEEIDRLIRTAGEGIIPTTNLAENPESDFERRPTLPRPEKLQEPTVPADEFEALEVTSKHSRDDLESGA